MWGFAIYGNKLPRTATNCDCDRGLEHTEGVFGKNGLTPQPRRLFLLPPLFSLSSLRLFCCECIFMRIHINQYMYINTSVQALNRYESNFRKNFSLVSQPSFQNQSVATHCLYLWMRSRENPSKRVSLSTRKVGHFCEIVMGWMYRTNKRMSFYLYTCIHQKNMHVFFCVYTHTYTYI